MWPPLAPKDGRCNEDKDGRIRVPNKKPENGNTETEKNDKNPQKKTYMVNKARLAYTNNAERKQLKNPQCDNGTTALMEMDRTEL
jgi:hypothetical protein